MPYERLSPECLEALQQQAQLPPGRFEELQATLTSPVRVQIELQPSYLVAIQSKLTYDLTSTLRKMDQTNAALTKKLVWLTVFLVVLTILLVVLTAILAVEAWPHFVEWIRSLGVAK